MKINEIISVTEGPNDPHIFKAIILAGGPGSGKSYVANKIAAGTGLKMVNSDIFYEYLANKNNLDLRNLSVTPKNDELRDTARSMKNKQLDQYLSGNLGLIIDGTGRNFSHIEKITEKLKSLGYAVIMVFVNTNLETAIQRNNERSRVVDPIFVKSAHEQIRDNIGKFQNYFGNNLMIVDNSKDSGTDFDLLWKRIQKFINS